MEGLPSRLYAVLNKCGSEILADWIEELKASIKNDRRISETELYSQAREFFALLESASSSGARVEEAA